MEYEGQICRAPMERGSFMLPVMVGCSYNQCRFCMLFKHLKFRVLPLEQIEKELQRVEAAGGRPEKIFLGDGNAFGLKTERLLQILDLIHQYFPECRTINMDATVTGIHNKSEAELCRLRREGVSHLYLGIESGLDDVLRLMKKDHTISQAYRETERLKEAGLVYDAHMMTGIAGKGRGIENGERTAEFFNRTGPSRIVNFSLFLHRSAPLYQEIQKGIFTPADERENLEEEDRLLSLLEVPGLEYDGFHDFLEVRVRGKLPKDREKMRAKIQMALAGLDGKEPIFAFVD